jgi:hypothetical protein
MWGVGFRVYGVKLKGSEFWSFRLGLRANSSTPLVQGSGFRVQGSGSRVQGSGLKVQGLEFGVQVVGV